MIPSLYMDYVVLYDCTWIEEGFLRGKMVELQGWAIWPWQYTGPAEYIPMELFDGLPEAANFKQEISEVNPNNRSQGQQKESFVTPIRQPEVRSLSYPTHAAGSLPSPLSQDPISKEYTDLRRSCRS